MPQRGLTSHLPPLLRDFARRGDASSRRTHAHVKRHDEDRLLEEAITKLELDEPIDRYLRTRYLEYLRWLEDRSARNLILYYSLRIPAMVIAAIVPALAASNPGEYVSTIVTERESGDGSA